MQKFIVVRAHQGDQDYAVGDVREAALADVKHLIPKVLVPADEGQGQKAETAVDNKAEPAAANKAMKAAKNK